MTYPGLLLDNLFLLFTLNANLISLILFSMLDNFNSRSKFGILETSEFCQLHLNIFIYTLIKDNNCGNIFQKIAYVYIVLHKTIGGLKGLISRFI